MKGRLLSAVVISPFVGAFVGACANSIMWWLTRGPVYFDAASNALAVLVLPIWALYFGTIIGLPAMLLLGLPAHYFLSRMKWRHIGGYIVFGIIGGAAAFLIFFGVIYLAYGSGVNNALDVLPLALEIGVATSAAFWLIRRPDRVPPNPATPPP